MNGKFAGVGDFECDVKQIWRFADEVDEMYAFKRNYIGV